MAGLWLILEIEAAAIAVTVEFNGVTLSHGSFQETVRQSSKINGWALSGENRIQVLLAKLPPLKRAAKAEPEQKSALPPRFLLRLREVAPGTPDEQDRRVLEYVWDTATQPLLGLVPVTVFEQSFPASPVAEWSWTQATPVIRVTAEDREAIAELLQRLQHQFSIKAVVGIISVQKTQIVEQAIALGLEPQRMLEGYEHFLKERMSSPGWKVLPFEGKTFMVISQGNGRMQRITDAKGAPPIVTTSEQGIFTLDPYVSKINGRWVIVR